MYTHDRTMLARLGFADPDKKNPTHDLACQYLALSTNAQSIVDLFVIAEARDVEADWYGVGRTCGKRTSRPTFETAKLEHAIHKGSGQYQTTIGFLDVLLTYNDPWEEVGTLQFSASYRTLFTHYGGKVLTTNENGRLRWQPNGADLACRLLDVAQPVFDQLQVLQNKVDGIKHLEKTTQSFVHYDHRLSDSSPSLTVGCAYCLPGCACHSLIKEADGLKGKLLNASASYISKGSNQSDCIVIEVKATPTSLGEVLRQFNLYRGYIRNLTVIWVLVTTYDLNTEELVTLEREGIKHIRLGSKFEKWCVEQRVPHAPPAGQIEL